MNRVERMVLLTLTRSERRVLASFWARGGCQAALQLPRVLPVHRDLERGGFVRIAGGGAEGWTARLEPCREPVVRAESLAVVRAHGRVVAPGWEKSRSAPQREVSAIGARAGPYHAAISGRYGSA